MHNRTPNPCPSPLPQPFAPSISIDKCAQTTFDFRRKSAINRLRMARQTIDRTKGFREHPLALYLCVFAVCACVCVFVGFAVVPVVPEGRD